MFGTASAYAVAHAGEIPVVAKNLEGRAPARPSPRSVAAIAFPTRTRSAFTAAPERSRPWSVPQRGSQLGQSPSAAACSRRTSRKRWSSFAVSPRRHAAQSSSGSQSVASARSEREPRGRMNSGESATP